MSNAHSAYNKNQGTSEDLRITEGRALLRCAAKMEAVQSEGVGYFDYCDAVRQNQKLWTLFQASLMAPESGLPAELSNLLKSLSLYVDRRSLRAFADHNPKLLDVLININKQIAAGLMQPQDKPAESSAAAPMPAATMPSDTISIV